MSDTSQCVFNPVHFCPVSLVVTVTVTSVFPIFPLVNFNVCLRGIREKRCSLLLERVIWTREENLWIYRSRCAIFAYDARSKFSTFLLERWIVPITRGAKVYSLYERYQHISILFSEPYRSLSSTCTKRTFGRETTLKWWTMPVTSFISTECRLADETGEISIVDFWLTSLNRAVLILETRQCKWIFILKMLETEISSKDRRLYLTISRVMI